MKKWVFRVTIILIVVYAASLTYTFYRKGYFSLPDLPDGAYTLSSDNGLRAIILDADISNEADYTPPKFFRNLATANRDRRYLGFPLEVEPWFEEAWSWCKKPTALERDELERTPEEFKRQIANARFEAVCRIDVDGKEIVRGLIFSVPRL
ncbi:hypothetical protein [Thioclava electrotropha]|uniref:Histidine kinase n=1 Tax=Thioclava electrotropha TaxID=1549850 RepID=A0ABX6YXP9_9RHOB|nr:hypothetical protein [Thioclava electrotropha]QPZ92506.1 hypothetical protein AKL02_017485 [Thioclava electrotropha]